MKPGNVLGIIGGLGPLATLYFYELLMKMQKVKTEQEYLNVFLYSKPSTPDRTVFMTGQSSESPYDSLLEAGKRLEEMGVCLITIPCVTAHFFYEKLAAELRTPVLNIITETVEHLHDKGIKKAGLLATDGTLHTRLFHEAMESRGMEIIQPTLDEQKTLMHLIYDNIKHGASVEEHTFLDLSGGLMKRGAETVILGCTELSLVSRDLKLNDGFTDTLVILAKATLRYCGAEMICA